MLITFIGTKENENQSLKAMTACATLFNLALEQTAIVLQLGTLKKGAEHLLKGKQISNNTIIQSQDSFMSTDGIDVLLRLGLSSFDANKFRHACMDPFAGDLVARDRTTFAVVPITKKPDFEKRILETKDNNANMSEHIVNILKNCEKHYEHVFVYMPSEKTDFVNEFLSYSDVIVHCLAQGESEPLYSIDGPRQFYLLTDFEKTSKYSVKVMEKKYPQIKKFFIMPHNVQFEDAAKSGILKEWLASKKDATGLDEGYDLVKNLVFLLNAITGYEKEEDKNLPAVLTREKIKSMKAAKITLSAENVEPKMPTRKDKSALKVVIGQEEDNQEEKE